MGDGPEDWVVGAKLELKTLLKVPPRSRTRRWRMTSSRAVGVHREDRTTTKQVAAKGKAASNSSLQGTVPKTGSWARNP
jgi:hypothetical protein